MKRMLAVMFVVSVCSSIAISCDGMGGLALRGSGGGFKGADANFGPGFSPMNQGMTKGQAQFNLARQTAFAQARQYNARMAPIRIARAAKVRADKLASRDARKTIRIAQLQERRDAEKVFLAKSKTWSDRTGNFKVDAILVDANRWGVKLQKRDGRTVNVPMERLSSSDQVYVAAMLDRETENGVMLAGL